MMYMEGWSNALQTCGFEGRGRRDGGNEMTVRPPHLSPSQMRKTTRPSGSLPAGKGRRNNQPANSPALFDPAECVARS